MDNASRKRIQNVVITLAKTFALIGTKAVPHEAPEFVLTKSEVILRGFIHRFMGKAAEVLEEENEKDFIVSLIESIVLTVYVTKNLEELVRRKLVDNSGLPEPKWDGENPFDELEQSLMRFLVHDVEPDWAERLPEPKMDIAGRMNRILNVIEAVIKDTNQFGENDFPAPNEPAVAAQADVSAPTDCDCAFCRIDTLLPTEPPSVKRNRMVELSKTHKEVGDKAEAIMSNAENYPEAQCNALFGVIEMLFNEQESVYKFCKDFPEEQTRLYDGDFSKLEEALNDGYGEMEKIRNKIKSAASLPENIRQTGFAMLGIQLTQYIGK